ncbi:unnamed protein product [Hymenolepis diminuta]|uniref:Uncharacterized protein n=1 Tax=Hymenolepis diminuta TaxID=6216 RepID=A0A0R3SPV6_HYMDI|nr:unnamed protein product [Hymenolepis diminuta]
MSVPPHCLLILSALVLLSGIYEHSQVVARIVLLPKRLREHEYFLDGNEEMERNRREGFTSSSFYYPRTISKRGPELFIPYMEA